MMLLSVASTIVIVWSVKVSFVIASVKVPFIVQEVTVPFSSCTYDRVTFWTVVFSGDGVGVGVGAVVGETVGVGVGVGE